MPEIKLNLNEIKSGIKYFRFFIQQNNIVSSKSEARRAIANNGLKINNQLIEDEKILQATDFKVKILKISFGKKKHFSNKNYLNSFFLSTIF